MACLACMQCRFVACAGGTRKHEGAPRARKPARHHLRPSTRHWSAAAGQRSSVWTPGSCAKPGSDVKRLHWLPATKLALVRKYHAAKAVDPMLTQEAWCKQNNVARLSFRQWLPAQSMKGLTQAAATWTGRRSTRTPSDRLARYPVQEDGLLLAYTERHLGCQLCCT